MVFKCTSCGYEREEFVFSKKDDVYYDKYKQKIICRRCNVIMLPENSEGEIDMHIAKIKLPPIDYPIFKQKFKE